MINAVIEFSARNKIIIFILIAAAVMGGIWSMKTVFRSPALSMASAGTVNCTGMST